MCLIDLLKETNELIQSLDQRVSHSKNRTLLGQHSIKNKSFCCPVTFQLFLDLQDKGFTQKLTSKAMFYSMTGEDSSTLLQEQWARLSYYTMVMYQVLSSAFRSRHLLNSSCLNEMLRIQQWNQGLLPVWDGDVINVLWPWRNWALMNLRSLFITWLLCEVSEEPFGCRVCVLPTPFCFALGRTIKSIGDSTIQAHLRSFDYHTE